MECQNSGSSQFSQDALNRHVWDLEVESFPRATDGGPRHKAGQKKRKKYWETGDRKRKQVVTGVEDSCGPPERGRAHTRCMKGKGESLETGRWTPGGP